MSLLLGSYAGLIVLTCKSTFNDMRNLTVDSVSLASPCANLKVTFVFQLAQVLDESAGVSPTFEFGNLFQDETLGKDLGCPWLPICMVARSRQRFRTLIRQFII